MAPARRALACFEAAVGMAALGAVLFALLYGAASCSAAQQEGARKAVTAVEAGAVAVGHPKVAAAVEGGWKLWQAVAAIGGTVAAGWGARKAHRVAKRRRAAKGAAHAGRP